MNKPEYSTTDFTYEFAGMKLDIYARIEEDGHEPDGRPHYYVSSLDVMHENIELDIDEIWKRKTLSLSEGVKFETLRDVLEELAMENREE